MQKTTTGAVGLAELQERTDGYVDLRSYAAIGDTRSVALVAHDGSIDWYAIPALDGIPVFAGLLDAESGGRIEVRPVEEFTVDRDYLPGTNVLCTTFTTRTGVVRVIDSLNIGTTGPLPWNELARRIEGVSGEVQLRWTVTPGTGLGAGMPWSEETHHGVVVHLNDVTLGVITQGADEYTVTSRSVSGSFSVDPGSSQLLAVVATQQEPVHLPPPEAVLDGVVRTIEYWTRWSERLTYDGPWSEEVLRSALTLRLLTNAETGAIAAAATTSLPENWHGTKNWDYRFAWVRDAAYTLHALIAFGEREEAHSAVSWLLRVLRKQGADIRMFATLAGDPPSEETEMRAEGWRGIGPVVSGNRAADQLQLSVYGDLFNLVRHYADSGHLLDTGSARLLADIADRVCNLWQLPDCGIWELLEERHYTSSKMGCWQALDCAVALADSGQLQGNVDRWRRERDHIRDWVDENCWSEELRSYTWYPGSDGLDTSVLLYSINGFDRGERMSDTIDAVMRELATGPLLHRFSGAADEEGAFVACSFWTVAALVCVGRRDEAEDLMAQLVPLANDVGLFTEMIDPSTLEFLGNFPQGLSHLALMAAALELVGEFDEGAHQ